MYRVLKNELKRGIFNKWTLLSFLCVAVFCIMHFMEVYDSCVFIDDIGKEFGYIGVEGECEATPYDQWILFSPNQHIVIIFFIMPILATLPYGTSFYSEMKIGYVKQMVSRMSMKTYMRAKYIATFITGGMVVVVPMLAQFFALATILPLHKPYRYYMAIIGEETFCIDLFYEHPMIYTLFRILLVFVVAGLLATLALLVSKHIYNYFSVFITPFVLSFMLIFLSRVTGVGEIDFSATLHAQTNSQYNYSILFVEIIILFVCTYFGFVSSKKEVY